MKPKNRVLILMMVLLTCIPGVGLSQEIPTATLIFYQKSSWASGGFSLYLNDQLVVDMIRERRWFKVEVPAGRLKLETRSAASFSTSESKTFFLEVEPGRTYHLEALVDYDLMIRRMYLYQRTEEESRQSLERYQSDPNAKSHIE